MYYFIKIHSFKYYQVTYIMKHISYLNPKDIYKLNLRLYALNQHRKLIGCFTWGQIFYKFKNNIIQYYI